MKDMSRAVRKFFVLVLIAVISLSAVPSPSCARKKKKRTPEEALAASVKHEIEIGDKIAEEIAKHFEFIEDPVYTARIRGIFDRLTPWVARPLPYNIHIVREKSPNAFCVPGGNIYVTTGLIEFARSDSELAYVIAHELAHADGKHGIIQVERNQKLTLATLAIMIASRGAAAAVLLSQAASVVMANAYSRDLEQEADIKAAEFAEKGGYDLVAGVTIMERLAQEELKQPWRDPTVQTDHPRLADRIDYIAETVESRGYKINRKQVLKYLRAALANEDGKLVLKVDGREIASGAYSPELEAYMQAVCDELSEHLQMETESFEIRIIAQEPPRKLVIGVSTIMTEPVPGAVCTLEQVRERLVEAVRFARKKHPLANYSR